ncbi:FAD-dependent oxidoreductase [Aliiglaciecola sp. CAU 1673]|uniref:NAD(P)/FAD-dependent oxidoreductase n=1 Tax=Aliiglaciecola sp. CAU 1673 TaxID=3032595 RepID=UPI0023DCCD87|nr:FAD-dependent oxidoreductase [Aliiglaciecola sp. CAU 1673]MDF2178208.1 FAD-dependent oxidoreductase [Aliiglaciecola sp. CAU 1673]
MSQRIAIIGSGISGLVCAHLLHKNNAVQVFEANDYIGGHTHTVDVQDEEGKEQAVDTGFIVFNDWTYPNFIKLMDKLDVARQPTQMSFSVTNEKQNLEYNGHTLNTLFAQRRNLLRPRFYRMIGDILRFNKLCKARLKEQTSLHISLGEFLDEHGFGETFVHNYILPMCAAIWSSSLEDVRAFSLHFFLEFFENHGLLNIVNRPQWYTLIGGSRAYIAPMIKGFEDKVLLNSPVTQVAREGKGWTVSAKNQPTQQFDQVIFACHSDQALAMLEQPTTAQKEILSALPYAQNEVVLHRDLKQLPKRKLAWASWNYQLRGDGTDKKCPPTVTYNMNILQRLQSDTTFCVSLNNPDIASDKRLMQFEYAHPQFSQRSKVAQQRRSEICGHDGLHFCGAYWYNGFHEDGVRSALDVCERFGERL